MEDVPRLVAVGGPEEGRAFALDPAGVTLGRHPDCPVAVSWDAGVSRHHAQLTCRAGLFWLEDLGSKHGTFVSLPGGAERRLDPHRPALLFDGMTVRLGQHARFRMDGGVASGDEAVRRILSSLQDGVRQLCAGLAHLPVSARERQLAQMEGILRRLEAAASEGELLQVAAEGVPTLDAPAEAGALPAVGPGAGLPPLPEHLPDPGDPARLKTLHNVFVASLRACLPDEGAGEGDARG